jgi:hypothetical protein
MVAPKTIKELLNALQSSPQDKEGAFRIATWRMVLESFTTMQEEINSLKQKLGVVEKTAQEASEKQPNTEAIKKAIKDDISKVDAQKILF